MGKKMLDTVKRIGSELNTEKTEYMIVQRQIPDDH